MRAVELGALHYLIKPVDTAQLEKIVTRAARLNAMARIKREALTLVNDGGIGVGGRIAVETAFERALSTLWVAYQPIVHAREKSLFGFEALLRSDEAALPHPGAVLDAAERLGRVHDLGQAVRLLACAPIAMAPPKSVLFVNLHARDLLDDSLFSTKAPLAAFAHRVVLEITERASLDEVKDTRGKVAALRAMGFRIAIDDLGAGYAGLTSFTALEPEFVKLDMSLIRDVDTTSTKQKLVRSMTTLCKDLGMTVVAEGIETPAERDCLVALECDLLQGFLHGKPQRPFPRFTW